MAALCLNFNASAQHAASKIQPLKVGDYLPDEVWNTGRHSINNSKGTDSLTLNNYKDKLIILDFWATWCVPCIKSFPLFNELQTKYAQNVQFILVSPQTKETQESFFRTHDVKLPSIVDDKTLKEYFPHNSVPHEVWIKNRKVVAITHANYVTEKNLIEMLNRDTVSLPLKKDNLTYDSEKPLLIDSNGESQNDLLYHSILTKYMDGVNGGGGIMTDSIDRFKIRAINASVLRLYQTAVQQNNLSFSLNNRAIWDSKFKFSNTEAPQYNPTIQKYFYCYELILPSFEKARAGNYMLADLNRYFASVYHIRGLIEKRRVICLVLKKTAANTKPINSGLVPNTENSDNYQILVNEPFSNVFTNLEYQLRTQSFPVIDQTGIKANVDMTLPLNGDLTTINFYLAKYGLRFYKQECVIEMLVFKNID